MHPDFKTQWMSSGYDYDGMVPLYRYLVAMKKMPLIFDAINNEIELSIKQEPFTSLSHQITQIEKNSMVTIEENLKRFLNSDEISARLAMIIRSDVERKVYVFLDIFFKPSATTTKEMLHFNSFVTIPANTIFFKNRGMECPSDINWEEILYV